MDFDSLVSLPTLLPCLPQHFCPRFQSPFYQLKDISWLVQIKLNVVQNGRHDTELEFELRHGRISHVERPIMAMRGSLR